MSRTEWVEAAIKLLNLINHILTMTVLHWLPVFTRKETVQILLDSLKYMQSHENMKIYAWVILENHIHFIAQSNVDLNKDVQGFKSFTARMLINFLKEKNVFVILEQLTFYKKAHKKECELQFWQESSHPVLIDSLEKMKQKIDYIHQNPVKRGYVDLPEHYRYSSARQFVGMESLLLVESNW